MLQPPSTEKTPEQVDGEHSLTVNDNNNKNEVTPDQFNKDNENNNNSNDCQQRNEDGEKKGKEDSIFSSSDDLLKTNTDNVETESSAQMGESIVTTLAKPQEAAEVIEEIDVKAATNNERTPLTIGEEVRGEEDNDELILPHDPSVTIANSIPNRLRLRSTASMQPRLASRRSAGARKCYNKQSPPPVSTNCRSYSLVSSDEEMVIDTLPACVTCRDPLECPPEEVGIDNSSNRNNNHNNNNKQVIKTATATLHISKNITVKRITTGPKKNHPTQRRGIAESKPEEEANRWQEFHPATTTTTTTTMTPTPQSNFLDAIDLRPTTAAGCRQLMNQQGSVNPHQTPPQFYHQQSSLNIGASTSHKISWLQEFIRQFVDPKLSPSHVCLLLLQRVFSYKDYHRIKSLRNDINIKGSMIDHVGEQQQNQQSLMERVSILRRLQQQLRSELRRALLHRNQLTPQGEQFWQITTSSMNAARTLSQARILITHRLTGEVTLKTHNYSPVEETPLRGSLQVHQSINNGHATTTRLMQNPYASRERYGRGGGKGEEDEYKPPYKVKQESMQQERLSRPDNVSSSSSSSSVKRSLRVRTKRHYDDNFTYDDEMLMNHWEDIIDDYSVGKRKLSKTYKPQQQLQQQQQLQGQESTSMGNSVFMGGGNQHHQTIVPTAAIKREVVPEADARNGNGNTQNLHYRSSGGIGGQHWPLNIDRTIHTNCANKDLCVICHTNVSYVVQHYVNAHRGSEVYVSRLNDEQLQYLRRTHNNNNNTAITMQQVSPSNAYKNHRQPQYETMCIFCLKTSNFMLSYWYQHFTTHTGEYAFRCLECGVRKPSKYLLTQCHQEQQRQGVLAKQSYPGDDDNNYHHANIVQDYNFDGKSREIVAHLCTLCNYIQLQRKNIMKHLYTQHQIKCILPQHTEKLILLRIPDESHLRQQQQQQQQQSTPSSSLIEGGMSQHSTTKPGRRRTKNELTNKTEIATINLDDSSSSDSSRGGDRSDLHNAREEDYGDDLSYMICGMLDVEIITK